MNITDYPPQHQDSPPPDPGPALAQVALGVPLLLLAGFLATDEIAAMRGSATTQAQVVRFSNVLAYTRAGARAPNRDLHAPVLAFRTPDGWPIEVISRDYTNELCCQAGETVTVRFPAGAPEQATVVRFWDVWRWPAMLGAAGLGLMASGLLTWRVMRRRQATALIPPAIGPVRRG